jgi:hypothetical protein
MFSTARLLLVILLSLLCVACSAERNGSREPSEVKYNTAVLKVNWGLYAKSAKTVTIKDPVVISELHAEFVRIKSNTDPRPRVDWKPSGSLTFQRGDAEKWTVVLGITEWTAGGEPNVEYPLSKDLQSRLKRLASDETLSTDK